MRNLILLTLALLALAAVADSTYTFRVVMTNEDWEETGVDVYSMYADETGKIWLLGNQSDSTSNYAVKMDTLLNIDTLYNALGTNEYQGHLIEYFQSFNHYDTLRWAGTTSGDTMWLFEKYDFDSIRVTPLFKDEPAWVSTRYCHLEVIGENGWALFAYEDTLPDGSKSYFYAIGKNGEPVFNVDSSYYNGSYSGGYFAVQKSSATPDEFELTVYDTTSGELYSKSILDYQFLRFGGSSERLQKMYSLEPDGSVFYLEGPVNDLTMVKADGVNEYRFEIPYPDSIDRLIIDNLVNKGSNLVLATAEVVDIGLIIQDKIYFLNTQDTLQLLWNSDTPMAAERIGFFANGDICIVGSGKGLENSFSSKIAIYSKSDGELLATWPDGFFPFSCWPGFKFEKGIVFLGGCPKEGVSDHSPYLIKIEGGE
jgi:hypothetical protein